MLYLDCQMFEFHHLPVQGGVLDQDPDWLEAVRVINHAIAREEELKEKRDAEKQKYKGR